MEAPSLQGHDKSLSKEPGELGETLGSAVSGLTCERTIFLPLQYQHKGITQ